MAVLNTWTSDVTNTFWGGSILQDGAILDVEKSKEQRFTIGDIDTQIDHEAPSLLVNGLPCFSDSFI